MRTAWLDQGNPFVAWTLKCRQAAGELITTGITDFTEQVAILNSLLLGYRSQMPFELYRAFAATGTLHVFAISGEHVVVLGSVIVFIISVAGLQRTYWVLFLGPLIVLYTVMTGLQPSAIRACVMGIAFWLAPLFGRKPDIFASLALSAVLILAFVPPTFSTLDSCSLTSPCSALSSSTNRSARLCAAGWSPIRSAFNRNRLDPGAQGRGRPRG